MPRYECRVARIAPSITTHWMLSRMAWVATKLYNTAMWNARETWDKTGKIPTGFELHKPVLASDYREYLHTHTAQKCADMVGRSFRSWFKLRKQDKTAHPPGFRPKERLSTCTFTLAGFKVESDGRIRLSIGKKLREELSYPDQFLWVKPVWNTPLPLDGKFQEVEIVPREGFFELHAKLELPEPIWRTEGQVMAVDLGMRNPIVSMSEDGQTDIFKGGGILQTLHYWNKEKARVQSEVMERSDGKKKWSHALSRMAQKAARQVKHALHGLSSAFVELCRQRDVKEVVVGDLKGIKKEPDGTGKNWRDKSSQNWQQFPTRELVAQCGYKLARLGIRLKEQDERGTSRGRCSLCGCTDWKKLHRVHRGLFLCENCGGIQNADVNGVRNQQARYLRRENAQSSSGLLARPAVHRWDGHLWKVAT